MSFSFHPDAEDEFIEAIDFYEDREAGLGFAFSLEIHTAIQNIVAHPGAWPVMEDDVRRCLMSRFPYAVLYVIEHAEILILAIMHQKRRPGYWKERSRA